MLKVAIIGTGNAGNQVADLGFKELKIPAIAINSSEGDLSNVSIDKLSIGTQGTGKDRTIAKEYLLSNFDNILKVSSDNKLFNLINDKELVFIVSSTGGGSGSGTAPILYEFLMKMFPAKSFILVGILPELRESLAAQQNTIEYLKEVQNINGINYMLYDNERRNKLPISNILLSVNNDIIEDINILRGMYQFPTPLNSIDEKDTFKIVNTPGMINVSKVSDIKDKDLDNNMVEDLLINYIKNNSCGCEMERDGIVKRTGLIINLSPKLQKFIDKSLPKVREIIGEPVESFEHDYINYAEEINRAILILAGLSIPDDRIEKIINRINETMKLLNVNKSSSLLNSTPDESVKELRREESRVATNFNASELFEKYLNN